METLRLALRKLAKAVVVVTTQTEGERFAMSATAVCEVSFDPPTMLVCVNRNAAIHRAMCEGGLFCLNILGIEHEGIARNCGGLRKGEDRFAEGHWIDTSYGVPVLADAEASVVCKKLNALSVGTHDVFIGEVVKVLASESAAPLVYMDGRYGQFTGA